MKLFYKRKDCFVPATNTEIFGWNIIGSLCNSFLSIVFSIVIARVCLPYQSDVFSIAFALATQIWTIANFEMGTLQVTDSKNKYSPNNYFSFKIILCITAATVAFSVVAFNLFSQKYNFYKAAIVSLFCIYKIMDAISNYYHSVFQKNGHLNIGGYSMSVRATISILIFTIAIILTKNLVFSIIAIIVSSVLWILFYDIKLSSCYSKTRFSFEYKKIFSILWECLPLFLSSFLITYIINIPKYSIDLLLLDNEGIQTAYSALFQPAAIINLFCLFIFRPTLSGLAEMYNNKKLKQYTIQSLKIFAVTLVFSLAAILISYCFGIPVLKIFYGKEYILDEHRLALIFIVAGGAFYAFSQLLYNMITVIRYQHFLLIGYAIDIVVAKIFVNQSVKDYGINGAAGIYFFSMILLFIIFLIIFVCCFIKSTHKKTEV